MHSTPCPICSQVFRRGNKVIQFDGRLFHPECYRTNRQRVLSGVGFHEQWTSNHFLHKLRELRRKVDAVRTSNGIHQLSKALEEWTHIGELDDLLASAQFHETSNSVLIMQLQNALSKQRRELDGIVSLFQRNLTSDTSLRKAKQKIEELPKENQIVLNQLLTKVICFADRMKALHNEIMKEVENTIEYRINNLLCTIKEIPKKVQDYTC